MLREYLTGLGHEVTDLGPEKAERVDYPDYGYKLAAFVAEGAAERGVVLCGSGIGISITVNRNPACSCALVSEPFSAALAREHNDANVIAIGARLTGPDMAKACLDAFLTVDFAGGRRVERVHKLSNFRFCADGEVQLPPTAAHGSVRCRELRLPRGRTASYGSGGRDGTRPKSDIRPSGHQSAT